MNLNRWIRPAIPGLVTALFTVAFTPTHVVAQAAPAPDAATMSRYDTNRNGILDPDERAAMEQDRVAEPPTTPTTAVASDEVIQLSPFQVDASRDRGYFAENTLAGSRMNTNISDLGASISVITKQQLDDTASVDVNDIFRYEINTEGSATYTQATPAFRNDGILDVAAGGTQGNQVSAFTNATANRVRGLGVPSSAINYYPSIASIPMDSYNVQSLEVSRGPNSMLFGMGSPAGIVNQTTAQAALNRNTASVTMRVDSNESYRGTLSFNRGVIRDQLAVFGAFLYDNRQFERKPSYDKTKRAYGAVTYKPFEKTMIRAFVEGYDNRNRRPNTLTPRDFVTQWRLAGRPAYDPLTKRITILDTGRVVGPYVINASSPLASQVRSYIESRPDFDPTRWNAARTIYNGVSIFGEGALTNPDSVLFVPGINWVPQSRTVMQIQGGQLANWFQPLFGQRYRTAWGTAANPTANAPLFPAEADIWANATWADIYNRSYTRSEGWTNIANRNILGGYKYPSVTDRSVYDWEEINTNQMNFGEERATNYNVELEQEITRNLFLTAGWFRQDYDQFTNYTVGQLNVGTLFVDTSVNLPDGTPNPYFGKPYLTDFDPDRYINATIDDHFRAMLAYTPDFTRRSGWMKWLGRHQILGLWSRDESMAAAYRERLNYIAAGSQEAAFRYLPNPNPTASGGPTGWNFQSTGSLQRLFYLANPGDPEGQVTRASGEWNPLRFTGDIRVYDYAQSQFEEANVTTMFNVFADPQRNQRTLQSLSAGMTNYFWKDRIVTTFGVREDRFKARTTTSGAITGPDGEVISPALTSAQRWENGVVNQGAILNRWNKWDYLKGTTKTIGAVVRPFRGWQTIEDRAAAGNLFWEFVRDFGISYNKSDNFNAPPAAQVDPFGAPLPKPTGEGEDYGVQFSLFNNKLFARITWFEASNENERTSPGTTLNRLTGNIDQDLFRSWARTIAMINMGMDPREENFGQNLSTTEEDAVRAAAAEIWGLPYTYYQDLPGSLGATRDARAEGVEAQINYNPTRNWTMRFTFGSQETIYSNVLRQFDAWAALRRPVWESAQAEDYLLPERRNLLTYTTAGGRQADITNFWTAYGFNTMTSLTDQFGNTNVQNYYNINVQSQYLLFSDLNNQAAPGQRKYRWSFLTNYAFEEGPLAGWGVGGSQRWEDKAVIGYFGRASGTNPVTPNLIDVSDVRRPIHDEANWYTDLWVSYQRRLWNERVRMKLQLNVVNVFENGGLRPVAVNYDGTPYAFRIVDPRQFLLTATFEF